VDPWNDFGSTNASLGPSFHTTLRSLRPLYSFITLPTARGACGLTVSQSPSGFFWTGQDSMYNRAIDQSDSQHIKPSFAVYLGSESDIMAEITQSRYHDSLVNFIANLRSDVDSTLRIVIPIPYYGGYSNTAVRNATLQVKSEIQGVFVPFEMYPTYSDYLVEDVHYTTAGYDQIGADLATYLNNNGLLIETIIDSMSPTTLSIAGGESVRIRGRNFFSALDDGATLTVGDSSITLPTTYNDTTVVFVNKGYHSSGVENITLTNLNGYSDTIQFNFLSTVPPVIDSIRPNPQYRLDSCTAYCQGCLDTGIVRDLTTGTNVPVKSWLPTQIDFYTGNRTRGWYNLQFTTSDSLRDTASLRIAVPRKSN